MSDLYIAIDLGATKTRIALATPGQIVEKKIYPTPKEGDEETIPRYIHQKIIENWEDKLGRIAAIGVSSIGPLDLEKGVIVNSPNINVPRVVLRPLLEELTSKPVYMVNDCVAAVWGEKIFGDGRDFDNIVYVTLSTGVGAGAIVDGNLLLGKMGNAHEVGHLVVSFESDVRCGCGRFGHWEAYAGGNNIPRIAARLAASGKYERSELAQALRGGRRVDTPEIFSKYRAGDPLAVDVVRLFIKATGAGLASVINAYDPEIVVLGGSIILNNSDLLEEIVEETSRNIVTGMPVVKITRFGDDAGLYGALAIAYRPPSSLLVKMGRKK